MRLSQTSIIAASMIVAFVVFITVRGELPAYLSIFGVGSGVTPSGTGTGAGAAQSAISLSTGGGSGISIDLPSINLNYPNYGGGSTWFDPVYGTIPAGGGEMFNPYQFNFQGQSFTV